MKQQKKIEPEKIRLNFTKEDVSKVFLFAFFNKQILEGRNQQNAQQNSG